MTSYNLNTFGGAWAVYDKEIDPISRIEGHLGIKVRVQERVWNSGYGVDQSVAESNGNIMLEVKDANAHGNLWRGFENFLLGREANDAITFVQRICGVCPVPHGLASTHAVDTVFGYSKGHITFKQDSDDYGIPEKALLIRNLVLASEFLMSSITHFYHLAAPSYVMGPNMAPWTPYFSIFHYHQFLSSMDAGENAVPTKLGGGWRGDSTEYPLVPDANPATMRLWDAVIISYVRALKIRRLTFEAGALFAGRMPMTSCFVGGGVTTDGESDLTARANKFVELIRQVGEFIIKEYVPIVCSLGFLYTAYDNPGNTGIESLPGRGFGAGVGRFLSWGGFPELDDSLFTKGGVKYTAADTAADATKVSFTVANKADVEAKWLAATGNHSVQVNLKEDISNARYGVSSFDVGVYSSNSAYPGAVSRTKPARSNGYTYIKAPRWRGMPCEVGPFARLAVAGIYPVNGTSTIASTLTSVAGKYRGFADIYTTDGTNARLSAIADTIKAGLYNLDGTGDVRAMVVSWILGLKGGLSTMDRLRARALESMVLVQRMVGEITAIDSGTGALTWASNGWAHQLLARTGDPATKDVAGSTWAKKSVPMGEVQGWGAIEAPRGALMHQVTIKYGKITKYQCIVPTTWNGSPKTGGAASTDNGPIEKACIGVMMGPGNDYIWNPREDVGAQSARQDGNPSGDGIYRSYGGVEVLRVAQSFDPCIACAVH